MQADPNLEQRNLIMGLLALCLALYPATQLISAALGYATILGVVQAVLRYGLVAAIGLLARPIPVKIAVALLCVVFFAVDVLALTGLFNVYSLLSPPAGDFIYFQF